MIFVLLAKYAILIIIWFLVIYCNTVTFGKKWDSVSAMWFSVIFCQNSIFGQACDFSSSLAQKMIFGNFLSKNIFSVQHVNFCKNVVVGEKWDFWSIVCILVIFGQKGNMMFIQKYDFRSLMWFRSKIGRSTQNGICL